MRCGYLIRDIRRDTHARLWHSTANAAVNRSQSSNFEKIYIASSRRDGLAEVITKN